MRRCPRTRCVAIERGPRDQLGQASDCIEEVACGGRQVVRSDVGRCGKAASRRGSQSEQLVTWDWRRYHGRRLPCSTDYLEVLSMSYECIPGSIQMVVTIQHVMLCASSNTYSRRCCTNNESIRRTPVTITQRSFPSPSPVHEPEWADNGR